MLDFLNVLGPSVTASIAATITAAITTAVTTTVTATIATTIAASVAASIAAAVTASIAKPVEKAPALPEIGKAVPDPFSRCASLATPLELPGHECLIVRSGMRALAFWKGIPLNSVGLVPRCHRRDGLRLRGCWRQELDRVIARNSGDQVERSGCHFCICQPSA